MSDNKNRHRHKKFGGKSFIILPIIFFISIYLVLYVALSPFLSVISSATGLFFSKTEKNYSSEYNSIFVPLPDENTSEIKENTKEEYKVNANSTLTFFEKILTIFPLK